MEERPWFKFYDAGLPRTLHPYPACTLLDVLKETMRERPNHTAWIFKGARVTYAEMERLTDAFGAALVALGVQKGDRVALLMPNSPRQSSASSARGKQGPSFLRSIPCTPDASWSIR